MRGEERRSVMRRFLVVLGAILGLVAPVAASNPAEASTCTSARRLGGYAIVANGCTSTVSGSVLVSEGNGGILSYPFSVPAVSERPVNLYLEPGYTYSLVLNGSEFWYGVYPYTHAVYVTFDTQLVSGNTWRARAGVRNVGDDVYRTCGYSQRSEQDAVLLGCSNLPPDGTVLYTANYVRYVAGGCVTLIVTDPVQHVRLGEHTFGSCGGGV